VLSWLRNRDARWVKPVITLKVKHLAFGSGLLRHATVKGFALPFGGAFAGGSSP
jgi:hypothetical protein